MSIEIIQEREPEFNEFGEHTGWTFRIGKCHCGREILLQGWICGCGCGREYNSSGQQLAAREQWGCETGEHPADVAMAASYNWEDGQ